MVSCVDTVLLPDDKTVEEDFWKTKSDVQMMVNGAYASMANNDLQQRLLIWTMRSDELTLNTALNNNNLNQIYSANIQTTNGYANWNQLYAVINNCNLVIDKSASVMDLDPNYLEGDHRNTVGQMKALRSLCYFYLVRVFRDVPLILEPYKVSSQEMNVPQVAPAVVIDQIIADLEEVKEYTLSSQAVGDWQRCGYFTRDGVYALLADVYLWKAAIFGDMASYDKCVACCDKIRANRANKVGGGFMGSLNAFDDDGYNLTPYYNYYDDNFGVWNNRQGNGSESLFEIQFTNNTGLCNVYFKYKDAATAQPNFYASEVYAKVVNNSTGHVFNRSELTGDVRGFEGVFSFNGSAEEGFNVRKFVSEIGLTLSGSAPESVVRTGSERTYNSYDQNWIVYRVPDVMLMKAEALTEKARLLTEANADIVDNIAAATSAADSLALANELVELNQKISACNVTAARQIQITSTRARYDEKSHIDSTKYAINKVEYVEGEDLKTFVTSQVGIFNGFKATAETLELEVMNERARELCFEGKRWFDMLRYNYRHATGINYNTILADQGTHAKNYDEMLTLIGRKYTSGGSGVTAKMQTEPYLYMPILQSEMDVNPMLKQNPVYTDGGTMEKDY